MNIIQVKGSLALNLDYCTVLSVAKVEAFPASGQERVEFNVQAHMQGFPRPAILATFASEIDAEKYLADLVSGLI